MPKVMPPKVRDRGLDQQLPPRMVIEPGVAVLRVRIREHVLALGEPRNTLQNPGKRLVDGDHPVPLALGPPYDQDTFFGPDVRPFQGGLLFLPKATMYSNQNGRTQGLQSMLHEPPLLRLAQVPDDLVLNPGFRHEGNGVLLHKLPAHGLLEKSGKDLKLLHDRARGRLSQAPVGVFLNGARIEPGKNGIPERRQDAILEEEFVGAGGISRTLCLDVFEDRKSTRLNSSHV